MTGEVKNEHCSKQEGLPCALKKPSFYSIEVLYSCILKCKMCYMWQANARLPQELSVEEWKAFAVALKEFNGRDTAINITGGEPLLKENILDLLTFIGRQGFANVSMTTNGFLIDRDVAKTIADSGIHMISLSLDSIKEDVHDYVRGVKGAYANATGAIRFFEERPGRLQKLVIQTILMEPTLDGILELVAWADKKKISIYFMAITKPLCLPLDDNWHVASEHNFLWPKDIAKACRLIDELVRFKEQGVDIGNSVAQLKAFKRYFADPNDFVKEKKQCKMGEGMLKIGSTGEVCLCAEKGVIGNIRDTPLKDICFSEQARQVREAIKSCKTNCPQLINCYFEE
ncbi:MAG TPA: radical SAM protein [Patescibacteria group bacterium]|nr:radical SAM protein [Patescibacteria group bacterium]